LIRLGWRAPKGVSIHTPFVSYARARKWMEWVRWLGVVYLGSLLAMLWLGFYTFNDFSMTVSPVLTLANYRALFDGSNLDIVLRTVGMAAAVTVGCATLAFPIAYYISRHTSGRTKGLLYVSIMMPMWASYIVKAYAWTVILAQGGVVQLIDLLPALPLRAALCVWLMVLGVQLC
jgi:putative spermidine/putrescine transport system permease protein